MVLPVAPQALALLDDFLEEDLEPDAVTFGAAISACAAGGWHAGLARQLQDQRYIHKQDYVYIYIYIYIYI